MDRLFLDANVLISAAWGSLDLGLLWRRAAQGKCLLLASPYVAAQARGNLGRKRPDRLPHLDLLLEQVSLFPDPPTLECPVPLPVNDRPVMVAAIAAGATHLLSGDADFDPYFRKCVAGVLVLRPAEYL